MDSTFTRDVDGRTAGARHSHHAGHDDRRQPQAQGGSRIRHPPHPRRVAVAESDNDWRRTRLRTERYDDAAVYTGVADEDADDDGAGAWPVVSAAGAAGASAVTALRETGAGESGDDSTGCATPGYVVHHSQHRQPYRQANHRGDMDGGSWRTQQAGYRRPYGQRGDAYRRGSKRTWPSREESDETAWADSNKAVMLAHLVEPSTASRATRKWTNRSDARADFRFMSYNILAESLVHKAPGLVDVPWSVRCSSMLLEIVEALPCVLALQEVEPDVFRTVFTPQLQEHGYMGVHADRGCSRTDGCAVFWLAQRWNLLFHQKLDLFVADQIALCRENVALFVVLECRRTGRLLIVCNVHLLFNFKRGDVKLAQIDYCMQFLAALRTQYTCEQRVPSIIVCGDFNSTPISAMYAFVSHGHIDISGVHRAGISAQQPFMQGPDVMNMRVTGVGHPDAAVGVFDKSHIPRYVADLNYWMPRVDPVNDSGKHDDTEARQPAPPSQDASVRVEAVDIQAPTVTVAWTPKYFVPWPHVDRHGDMPGHFPPKTVLTHPLKLSSAYAEEPRPGCTGEPAFTTFHPSIQACVDYMWFSNQDLQVTGVLEMLSLEQLLAQGGLPSLHYGSDHSSLVADFAWKTPAKPSTTSAVGASGASA